MALRMTKDAGLESLGDVSKIRVGLAWDTSGGGRKGLLGKLKRHIGSDLDLAAVAIAGDDPVRDILVKQVGLSEEDALKEVGAK